MPIIPSTAHHVTRLPSRLATFRHPPPYAERLVVWPVLWILPGDRKQRLDDRVFVGLAGEARIGDDGEELAD
jgi:hypothetical protein